jgi:uncharacterized protein YdaU (DUF1376 family)
MYHRRRQPWSSYSQPGLGEKQHLVLTRNDKLIFICFYALLQEGEALRKQIDEERAALEKEKAAFAAELARLKGGQQPQQQQPQQQQQQQQRKPAFGLPFAFA